jgi:hypothetical protein
MSRNDRRDVGPGELRLIRLGHALWLQMKRDRRQNGGTVPQDDPIWQALETVWRLKREYRAELAQRRAVESAKTREFFRSHRKRP